MWTDKIKWVDLNSKFKDLYASEKNEAILSAEIQTLCHQIHLVNKVFGKAWIRAAVEAIFDTLGYSW